MLSHLCTYTSAISAEAVSISSSMIKLKPGVPLDLVIGDRVNIVPYGYKDGDVYVITGCQHVLDSGEIEGQTKCSRDANIEIAGFPLEFINRGINVEVEASPEIKFWSTLTLGAPKSGYFYNLDGSVAFKQDYTHLSIGTIMDQNNGLYTITIKFNDFTQKLKLKINLNE